MQTLKILPGGRLNAFCNSVIYNVVLNSIEHYVCYSINMIISIVSQSETRNVLNR